MTFLNMILLGGILAAGIPVIIHFFHRTRPRVVRWGAMHLLDTILKSSSRRLRLEQLLLLLVRVGIPLILAFCMARPVLTGMSQLLGNAKTSMILLVDNSYSLEAGGGSHSNFAGARDAAARVLARLASGSEVCLIPMAGRSALIPEDPTFDIGRVAQAVSRMDAGFGTAAAAFSLEESAALFQRMHYANRELVIISDFQRMNWSGAERTANTQSLDLLRKLPLPPAIVLYHVGKEIRDNLCVESLDFSQLVMGVGQKMRLRANLRNYGDSPYPDLKVYFRADGRERSVSQITLAPHEQGQVLFTHTFETAGSHVVEVQADADSLKADNSCLASIPVWDKVPVLIIDGDPSPEPLRSETDFLQIALQPFGAARMDLTDLIVPHVRDPSKLEPGLLAEHRVVILANVPQISDPQVKALENFVRDGGGLLIFPGSGIQTTWYNSVFFNLGKGLLPAPFLSLSGSLRETATPATIVSQHFDHPSLSLFNDPRNGNLADAQVRLWYRIKEETSEAGKADGGISVLARLDTGDPLFVEKRFGEGRVIQCAVPCDADWSNLPMRPFYLPLMQQLATYLASTVYPPRNVNVGQSLFVFLPLAMANKTAVLTDPEGNRNELPVVGKSTRSVAEFKKTQRPGLYTLEAPDGNLTHFVVNTSRKESDLQQLSEAELRETAGTMGGRVVHKWQDYEELDQRRRHGREIWKFLLWFVIGLSFTELFLQQHLTAKKG
ncbi:MAG: BatA domain-containing protein [Verrucomicrobia bacterium]|nr:BatA domain-containing protein [Verrucomicrobiota bacterium]